MTRPLISIFAVWALLLWSAQGCVKPTEPPQGKDSVACDTCKPDTVICDTCTIDTTDTTVVVPVDSTSHNFVWQELVVPGESKLTGCWVFGENSIYLLGGSLHLWNGSAFTLPDLRRKDGVSLQGRGAFADAGLFAFSPNDFWIINAGILDHFLKDEFENYLVDTEHRFDDPRIGRLNAAWGTSSRDLFVVGNGGTIIHYNGETWSKMESGTTRNLRSVWGTSHNDVWAAGFNESDAESELLHYNGVLWKRIDLATLGDIRRSRHVVDDVWATDSAGTPAIVTVGTLVWKQTRGKWWQDSTGLNRTSDGGFLPLGVRGNAWNDLITVGPYGFVAHWNGKSWKKYDELFESGNAFYGANASSFKGNTICIAGERPGRNFVQIGTRK